MSRRVAWSALALALLVSALAGAAAHRAWRWLDEPLALASASVVLTVEAGATPRSVAQRWVDAGVRAPSWALFEWFRWSGRAKDIRAGTYELRTGTTPRGLLAMMVQGKEVLESLRLLEGWTMRQVRAAIAQAGHLERVTTDMSDAQLMAELDAPGLPAEGRFFPDTYRYPRGERDLDLLRKAHQEMERHLQRVWATRAEDSPLKTPQEALILASIVEKETGLAGERGLVAGVFTNRLRIGMPLQTDPTIIYGLGESFDGNLRKKHLLNDGPFNTYTRTGLPPTPIAMPSLASLEAAVAPARTDALYFVARGDGSSEFSTNLADHNRAVNRYQRGR